jgi:hypothetical protein
MPPTRHAWQNRAIHARSVAMSSYSSFAEFYPFYLSEHSNRTCRRLHFVGSSLVLAVIVLAVSTGQLRWLWLMPVIGYGFAWVGHFAFEKNRPATFKHPLYSLAGDWVMYGQMLRGKIPF